VYWRTPPYENANKHVGYIIDQYSKVTNHTPHVTASPSNNKRLRSVHDCIRFIWFHCRLVLYVCFPSSLPKVMLMVHHLFFVAEDSIYFLLVVSSECFSSGCVGFELNPLFVLSLDFSAPSLGPPPWLLTLLLVEPA
jgi:hypothetical protein